MIEVILISLAVGATVGAIGGAAAHLLHRAVAFIFK